MKGVATDYIILTLILFKLVRMFLISKGFIAYDFLQELSALSYIVIISLIVRRLWYRNKEEHIYRAYKKEQARTRLKKLEHIERGTTLWKEGP